MDMEPGRDGPIETWTLKTWTSRRPWTPNDGRWGGEYAHGWVSVGRSRGALAGILVAVLVAFLTLFAAIFGFMAFITVVVLAMCRRWMSEIWYRIGPSR
jgi:type IV secretory pathway VirB6-like protein